MPDLAGGLPSRLCQLRRQHGPQDRLRFSLACPVGEPPHRAFLDRPAGFAASEQQGGGTPKGGLVADDEDGRGFLGAAFRPVDGGEEVGGAMTGSETRIGVERPADCLRGLLAVQIIGDRPQLTEPRRGGVLLSVRPAGRGLCRND